MIRPKVTELVMEWNASNDHQQQSGALLIAGHFLSAYCCYHHKLFSYKLARYWPLIAAGLLWPIAFCLLPFAYCPYYVDLLPIAYCQTFLDTYYCQSAWISWAAYWPLAGGLLWPICLFTYFLLPIAHYLFSFTYCLLPDIFKHFLLPECLDNRAR